LTRIPTFQGILGLVANRMQPCREPAGHEHPVSVYDNKRHLTMTYVAASVPEARRPATDRLAQGGFRTNKPQPRQDDPGREIDLRQLRHLTRNTLQRIVALITEIPGLADTPEGEMIARELEYRIALSATISNALFGLTEAPAPMADRLRQLGGAMVDMMRSPDQVIRIGVSVRGTCPVALREAVVRSANELIGNAVKHGMKARPNGRITVRLITEGQSTALTVTDNGWGFAGTPRQGEGLSLARRFAERHGGSLRLESCGGMVATMELLH
jgi:two-component sensor histidine kinase